MNGALQACRTPANQSKVSKAEQRWRAFCHRQNADAPTTTTPIDSTRPPARALAAFAFDKLFGGRIDLRRRDAVEAATARGMRPTVAGATAMAELAALRSCFDEHGWHWPQAPNDVNLLAQTRRALIKLAPTRGKDAPHVAPHQLVPFLPAGNDDRAVRDRALFMIRAVSLLRPSEPAEIIRSSITTRDNGIGGRIVTFKLRRTKGASMAGRQFDSNSVEFLTRDATVDGLPGRLHAMDLCPATLMLELKARVERAIRRARDTGKLAGDEDAHDSLFFACFPAQRGGSSTIDVTRPLGAERTSKIVGDIVKRAGAGTSHSLRKMSSQQLTLMGVEPAQIELRGGWSSLVASQVRNDHYTSNRLVRDNFADILFDARRRRTERAARRSTAGGHAARAVASSTTAAPTTRDGDESDDALPKITNREAARLADALRAPGGLTASASEGNDDAQVARGDAPRSTNDNDEGDGDTAPDTTRRPTEQLLPRPQPRRLRRSARIAAKRTRTDDNEATAPTTPRTNSEGATTNLGGAVAQRRWTLGVSDSSAPMPEENGGDAANATSRTQASDTTIRHFREWRAGVSAQDKHERTTDTEIARQWHEAANEFR